MIIALGASAYATQTRTMVMGWNDGIMVDDYNVMRFYGRTLNYPNLVIGEFSQYYYYYPEVSRSGDGFEDGQGFYNFGIHWEFNEDNPWVLATYVSTEAPLYPSDFFGDLIVPSWSIGGLQNRRIDLIYGRKLGDMNFGFLIDYNTSSFTQEETDNEFEQAFSYYRFGAGLTEGLSGQWDVALTFGFGSWTDVNSAGETVSEPDGYYDVTAEGRYFWVQNPKITLVPHAKIMMGKRGAKYGDEGDFTASETGTMFDGGMGMQYVTGPDLLAVIDFGVNYTSGKYEESDGEETFEEKYTSIALPYIQMGFEGEVFNWLDVRMGGKTYWFIDKVEDDYKENYAHNETYLGFGFHFGRLHIDTYTHPQLFLDGLNFISGTSNTMNFQISALYEMY
jgi:hypothetical protein